MVFAQPMIKSFGALENFFTLLNYCSFSFNQLMIMEPYHSVLF